MTFTLTFIAKNREAALNRLYLVRQHEPQRIPGTVLEFVEQALRGMSTPGLVTVNVEGNLCTEDSNNSEFSSCQITVQPLHSTEFVDG